MKKEGNNLRCLYCGRFIPGDYFDNGLAGMDFTPDSAYTTEKMEYYHNQCHRRHETEFMVREVKPGRK